MDLEELFDEGEEVIWYFQQQKWERKQKMTTEINPRQSNNRKGKIREWNRNRNCIVPMSAFGWPAR